MDGLESMYDDWTSSVKKSKEKRDAVATKKQNDKVGAEALRRAALGQFVAWHAGRDEDSNEENVFGVPASNTTFQF
jgi:mevalonate pyrophosphate decarboxylase